jgi:uncharacterized protein
LYVHPAIKLEEMNDLHLIRQVEEFAVKCITQYDSGHDWWHLNRVRNLALYLLSSEGSGDPLIIEVSALLHDIDDSKFINNELLKTEEKITLFLKSLKIKDKIINEVIFINKNISFSKGAKPENASHEFMIVQDADRLDAIGAIGIARAFNYGGFKNNLIYDPRDHSSSTIGHFYDKLLKVGELMNTATAKKLAAERHRFLELFLKQFLKEWEFVEK